MRSLAASLLGLGLAPFVLAQEQQFPVQSPAAAATSRNLSLLAGGQWITEWNAATQTPRSIYGTGIRLDWRENSLPEARRQALLARDTYSTVLGLGDYEWRESIGDSMGNAWSFTFDQYFRGLPCIGGRYDVRINKIGVIAYLGSTAWQIPADFDTTPKLSETAALAFAWQALGEPVSAVAQPGLARQPRLVIWGDADAAQKAPFFLAWEVPISNVDRDGLGRIGRYYVDARTGAILHWTSDKHECGAEHAHAHTAAASTVDGPQPPVATTFTVMAWTRTGNDAFSALVNTPLVGLQISVPGIGTVVTDVNGQFTVDIAAPVAITIGALDGIHNNPIVGANAPNAPFTLTPGTPATLQLLTAAASANEAAHPTTQWWIHGANEWVRSIVGNSTQMNTADGVVPTVNIASTCNAYYTGNTVNFYAAGGGCSNTAFSTVVVHEWGHGIDDRYGGISNNNGDGLSEGWGDIFGLYYTDQPVLGSGFQSQNVGIRDGRNTTMYGTQSEVHAAGEVWMGFAWRLRENLRTSLGTAQAVAISNRIVIGSIVANATNQANAVTQVFIADDDDGNLLNGVPHYAELSAAATAKGMPYPQIQLGTLTHAPLANSSIEVTPRRVVLSAVPLGGSFTAVRVLYSVAGFPTLHNMFPTGNPNEYHALLPGTIAGNTVTYHFEAVHSSGPSVRLPAAGEYTYTIGNDITFFSENFETGAPGWTSGLTAGQNDWQINAPLGRTGTGWADPATAPSGTRVAGNDLGYAVTPVNGNGAYTNNTNNWFRSPVINCTGRSGVRLRFKRWLTVETGQFDHANLKLNGATIFTNVATADTIDTSWQSIEIAIPAADNNPSVQLEWGLVSDVSVTRGGWTIDDVQLVAAGAVTPLPATLSMLPEQCAINAAVVATVHTAGAQPFVLAIGDTAGPTSIPGLPNVLVGGNYIALPSYTDASGLWTVNFNAPATVPATGLLWYSQVLTLDAALNFVVSNQFLNLFTPTP